MSVMEFKRALSGCNFLFDWQKDRLMAMLDGDDCGEGYGGNGHIGFEDAFPILDNVLWRTVGVGLDSLPVMDRIGIEQAVREVTH